MTIVKKGDRFITKEGYEILVVERFSWDKVLIEFQDEYKHQATIQSSHCVSLTIKNPYHKSVCGLGYVGVGRYKPSRKGVESIIYITWRSMINRCYSPTQLRNAPTYNDVTVCEEWFNFQVFAEWFEPRYEKGLALDKDILTSGNRLYSPDTCCLVPPSINSIFNHESANGNTPMGVDIIKPRSGKDVKFKSRIYRSGKTVTLGTFDSKDEASDAYKRAKEDDIVSELISYSKIPCTTINTVLELIQSKGFNELTAKYIKANEAIKIKRDIR